MSGDRLRFGALAVRWLLPVALLAASPIHAEQVNTRAQAPASGGGATAKPGTPPPVKLPWEDEIRAFERADQQQEPGRHGAPIVFMGSSSIRLWESLAQDFPDRAVLNRGFGGSQISDSVRYAERILVPHKPPLVVFYAGSNDINAGKSPDTVVTDFKAFTAKVRSLLPNTHIAFISIAPSPARWAQADKVRDANRQIAAVCETDPKLHFINVFSDMLGEDGRPRPELYIEDRLHMTRKGYQLWIPRIRQTIDKIVPPSPSARP